MLMQGGMNGAMYQNMLQRGPNGVPQNDLKRAAAMNSRPYVYSSGGRSGHHLIFHPSNAHTATATPWQT